MTFSGLQRREIERLLREARMEGGDGIVKGAEIGVLLSGEEDMIF